MRKYIVNLTDHLAVLHRYGTSSLPSNELRKHIALDLYIKDVADMRPEKLGEILCSLESGDVMATKQELLSLVHFSGDCGDMLRELVAACLAYVIVDRMDQYGTERGLPPLRTSRKISVARDL